MPKLGMAVARGVLAGDALNDAPIDPTWIVEGTPKARARQLDLQPDATIGITIWETTAGRFDWRYSGDEMIIILEGEAEMTPPGEAATVIGKGDIAHFAGGQVVRWHVPTYVKKVAIHSIHVSGTRRLAHRVPFLRQVVRKVKGLRTHTAALAFGTLGIIEDLAPQLQV